MLTKIVYKKLLISVLRVLILFVFLFGLLPISSVSAEDAGWALRFDGIDDYVDLGKTEDVIGLGWKSTKSFSMWIKPEGNANDCKNNPEKPYDVAFCDQILVNQPHFFGIARGIIDGQDRIWLWNHTLTGDQRIGIQYSPTQWLHIAYVHDGVTLKAYRNGILVGQVASGNTYAEEVVTTTNFVLGAFFKPEQQSAFEGIIDEVRIYSNVLSQQVINDTLRSTLIGNELGLRAYYQMSDGIGSTTLTDNTTTSLWDGTLKDGNPTPGELSLNPQWVISDCWDGPVAIDQLVNTNEDTSVSIILTGTPVGVGPLIYHLESGPSDGILSGTIPYYTYTPNENFNGQDSFTFYVQEGTSQSNRATVFIDVVPVNDQPVAVNDSYSVQANSILDVAAINGVLNNDTDIDGDSLTAVLVNNVQHGTLVLNSNGSFTYTPTPSYSGTDSFTYRANDGTVDSAIATVTINVVLGNVGPVAVNDSYSVNMNSILDVTVINGVLHNDTDINGDPLTAVLVNNVQHGTLIFNSNGSFTYTPTPSYFGADSFTYRANDGIVDSAIATVTISVFQANFKLYLPIIKK
ncbi:MAG: Ig-like domain-containing protein [Anaerolineaceae bacterium]